MWLASGSEDLHALQLCYSLFERSQTSQNRIVCIGLCTRITIAVVADRQINLRFDLVPIEALIDIVDVFARLYLGEFKSARERYVHCIAQSDSWSIEVYWRYRQQGSRPKCVISLRQ